ncbi:MAG TPA: APC family permease [Candidatus Dormibacteraeota bacterium]|nr:APC family permease [Candidatus Dormibacteraeota bacterium]
MASASVSGRSLERGAVGLVPVLFQSITHMAPAAAVAFSIIVGVPYAGGSMPLAVVLALVACILVAISVGQLARHMPSAGGLYTYNARGLGSTVGFLVAWGFMLAEPLVAPLLFLIFANVISANLNAHFGTPVWLWAPLVLVAAAVVWFLTYRGIRLSTGAGVGLGLFEIGVFVLVALVLIVAAGDRNTAAVLTPGPGGGLGKVFPGMIYAILAFIGFEASAPLGEEARDPRRTIPVAVVLSCLLIGAFYIFTTYAASVYFGPSRMADPKQGFVTLNGGDPWTGMATQVWGPLGVLVILAVVNSAIANANAGANAATRVGYALARIGLLPAALATVHPEHRTPALAVHVQAVAGAALALVLGIVLGGPLSAFALLGTMATIVVICIYVLTNVSNLVFHLRERRAEFNVLTNGVVPVLGVLVFLPALVASLGIDFGGLGITPLGPPANAAPAIIAVWLVLGVAALVYFRLRAPQRIQETAALFVE